jgi:6-phosphogluconolactonase
MPSPELRIYDTPNDLFQAAVADFVSRANAAILSHGKFTVALSGGSTPKSLYQLLASGSIPNIPWGKIYLFFGDERNVPPDHAESNYRMAKAALLFQVPEENVFRIPAEKDAATAAREYEHTLQTFFKLQPGQFPRFDLIYLGLGPDGHTASLFPGTVALAENKRLVVDNWVEKFKTYRITLTYPVLNHAACVTFLACGADKAPMLREVLDNKNADLPSQRVQPAAGELIWMVDKAATSGLAGK